MYARPLNGLMPDTQGLVPFQPTRPPQAHDSPINADDLQESLSSAFGSV